VLVAVCGVVRISRRDAGTQSQRVQAGSRSVAVCGVARISRKDAKPQSQRVQAGSRSVAVRGVVRISRRDAETQSQRVPGGVQVGGGMRRREDLALRRQAAKPAGPDGVQVGGGMRRREDLALRRQAAKPAGPDRVQVGGGERFLGLPLRRRVECAFPRGSDTPVLELRGPCHRCGYPVQRWSRRCPPPGHCYHHVYRWRQMRQEAPEAPAAAQAAKIGGGAVSAPDRGGRICHPPKKWGEHPPKKWGELVVASLDATMTEASSGPWAISPRSTARQPK